MLKTILMTIVIAAIFIWFCYSLWHDGYNDGMLEERRKRTRLMAQYNTSMSTFRTEIRLLWEDLNDLKKKMAAEKKPLTFTHEHSDEPIGKVVCTEECDDGLRFTIQDTEETLTPIQKEAFDSLCN